MNAQPMTRSTRTHLRENELVVWWTGTVRPSSRRAEHSAAAPPARVAGVGRDAGLLAEIVQVQPAFGEGIRVRFLHANGHNRAVGWRAVARFRDQDLVLIRVRRIGRAFHPRPGLENRGRARAAKYANRN